ncbi:GNAT family N-acetyltransferase [Hirschia baltica]|uniref:Ribosomal-protein-alanine acetyltransferase n=1 Tax=Hirschia baltica (strain ATCC 49814 / DSM 5838 / IFAM 1418) TaxID=582402 RepID=C6XMF4_HIRBI|nr:GNAT family N-acetyltransferase [Hirschia baltica]ACT58097.1 ribosomal-protein-alanine acetyltransferase [Hirschia baltica ATCC 49814]
MSNVLETERLILRPPIADDFDAWAAFMADEEDARFIGGAMNRAVAWRAMMIMMGSWSAYGIGMFSVIEKSSNEWIGRIGPWQPEGWPGTEVGWGIRNSAQGKGYALEAAAISMDYAVEHLGWSTIIHTIDSENLASEKLAKRLGSVLMKRDVFLPAPLNTEPVNVWGQTAHQWALNRQSLTNSSKS